MASMASRTAENWLQVKKNKNKTLLLGCLIGWSVCIATYAYQYLGGFAHWPYWCIIHLISLAGPMTSSTIDSSPHGSPLSLPTKLFLFLTALYMPFLTFMVPITDEIRTIDWLYLFIAFFAVDSYGCVYLASLMRLDYTFYWPLNCLVFGLAFSSGYGLQVAAMDPLWCKIVVTCSALAVSALSTLYLHLQETSHVTLARCFV